MTWAVRENSKKKENVPCDQLSTSACSALSVRSMAAPHKNRKGKKWVLATRGKRPQTECGRKLENSKSMKTLVDHLSSSTVPLLRLLRETEEKIQPLDETYWGYPAGEVFIAINALSFHKWNRHTTSSSSLLLLTKAKRCSGEVSIQKRVALRKATRTARIMALILACARSNKSHLKLTNLQKSELRKGGWQF